MSDTIIILMKYDEPEWKQTFDCAYKTGCPILIADRAGVGSMAAAYNRVIKENWNVIAHYTYVWFVSNIVFKVEDFQKLKSTMDQNYSTMSCIHPCFHSDHKHLKPKDSDGLLIEEVPFIEFTAPMMKVTMFANFYLLLDEDMPFVGHDLDWSYRAKKSGHKLFVHYGVFIQHEYIRKNKLGHNSTYYRKHIRKSWEAHTVYALEYKYGENWREVLGYHGAV